MSKFVIGDFIQLKGRSRHGKNRINQFGDKFKVVDIRSSLSTTAHRGCVGPFAFLNCDHPHLLEGSRWISLTDDPDFTVVTETKKAEI